LVFHAADVFVAGSTVLPAVTAERSSKDQSPAAEGNNTMTVNTDFCCCLHVL
jgi:hypothetical protein